ncbi:hypothetical protein F4821DRAFT_247790 [Hypoxylon rubiginosum]|uniref:Uncharacterized protein n=1 Tax=Hypoxylon rubiginosum TaxID=110542 RepID=A0ACC0CNV3_9PEZI|nr:hypothetical protein F4821DRAFT_247790 [Hypoxylon rubiginosum]
MTYEFASLMTLGILLGQTRPRSFTDKYSTSFLSLSHLVIPNNHTLTFLINKVVNLRGYPPFMMSSNSNFSFSSSSVSYSSSTTHNGNTTGTHYAEHTTSNPSGTTTHTASQRLGGPTHHEQREYDASGRLVSSEGRAVSGNNTDSSRRIQDVSDEQQRENDRLYEERIEDEYAKREGGA